MADFTTYNVHDARPLGGTGEVVTIGLGPGVAPGGTLNIRGYLTGTLTFTSDAGSGTYATQSLTALSGTTGSTMVGVGQYFTNSYIIPTGIVGLKITGTSITAGGVMVSWDYSAYNTPVDRNLEAIRAARRQSIMMSGLNYITETGDFALASSTALAATQSVFANAVAFLAGETVSTLHVGLQTISVSVTLAKVALQTKTGIVLGLSADASATMNGTTGIKPLALTSAVTIPNDDVYYLSFLAVGVGTQPTLAQLKGAVNYFGAVNSGVIKCAIQTGQADFPAVGSASTLTGTAGNRAFWMAAS